MNTYDVATWKGCEELAQQLGVTISLKNGFELKTSTGHMLGVLETVAEVFAFLCGYQHNAARRKEL